MKHILAAKILLEGISKSALARDGKTLPQIINSLDQRAKDCAVSKHDLIDVSKIKLADLIK